MPSLRERLRVISTQLSSYNFRDPLSEGLTQVVEAIKKSLEGGGEDEEDGEEADN